MDNRVGVNLGGGRGIRIVVIMEKNKAKSLFDHLYVIRKWNKFVQKKHFLRNIKKGTFLLRIPSAELFC